MARKIRKLQNEYRIPPEKRDNMLFLADEEEVLWAEGWKACDKVRAEGNDLLWISIWCPTTDAEHRSSFQKKYNIATEADHGTEDRPG